MEILLSESVRAILPGVQTQRGPSLKAVSPPLLHLLQVVRRAGLQDGELEQSLDDLGVYEGLVHHAVPVGREAVLGQVAGRSLLPDVTLMVSPPWPGQVSLADILEATGTGNDIHAVGDLAVGRLGQGEASAREMWGEDDVGEEALLTDFTVAAWGLLETSGGYWRLRSGEWVASLG